MFNPMVDIDRRIEDLQRLKENYKPQQPINIFNNANLSEFEARILNENENPDEILIQKKTAFINPKKGYLKIKDVNGDTTTYELIRPKTAEELKIEELERKLQEYEQRFTNANNEKWEPTTNDIKSNDSGAKTNGGNVPKKTK